ncbi:hypothetical protein HF325_002318 [Metschnikowia pulcherrima]|uniref:CBM21 domain-containing protein n=1 Tax=Metschnikowia pulcherrima TaxID=27326 RepID=A0A8H7LCR2_9ASCO|nr:hypothetical protein HF325_002318 [Metschnikowia pulcherrima]
MSIEGLFGPEQVSAHPKTAAAGPATKDHTVAANSQRLAPELRQKPPKFLLGGYLKSTPELGSHGLESAINKNANQKVARSHDDSESAVLWARAGSGAEIGATKGDKVDETEKKTNSLIDDRGETYLWTFQSPVVVVESPKIGHLLPSDEQPSVSHQRSVSEEIDAPPLRKLKLSLKLPKLTRLHSMSQLSPKSVRFAPRLEKIKMFDGRASPSTVSLQCTPMGSPKYDFPNDDYFSIRHHGEVSDDDISSSSDSDTYTEFTKDKQYKIVLSNFSSPQNIYDKRSSPVYLQSVFLTADKTLLELLVMCQNLAFEKSLSVKLTFNDWHSLLIFNSATYTKLFSSVNFDQFKFTIPLAHLPSLVNTQFCIKYSVSGTTFWDNNNSKNYTFSLGAYTKPTVSKDIFAYTPSVKNDTFTYKPPKFSPRGFSALESNFNSSSGASIPKSASPVPPYSELVSKLMSVRDSEQRPQFSRALTLSPRPRFSQSFISKKGTESDVISSPLGNTKTEILTKEIAPVKRRISFGSQTESSSPTNQNVT